MYNVSKSQTDYNSASWYSYEDLATAQAAAVAEAEADQGTWYVLEVLVSPVFKAEYTSNVATEIM